MTNVSATTRDPTTTVATRAATIFACGEGLFENLRYSSFTMTAAAALKLPASELMVAANIAATTSPIIPIGRTSRQSSAYTPFISDSGRSGRKTRAAIAGKKKSGGPRKRSTATRYAIFLASPSLRVE